MSDAVRAPECAGEKALIAMSGGVDSSVAALLMRDAGYDCMGVTMRLASCDVPDGGGGRTCCSLADAEDARSVAVRLGIPFYVFNFTGEFQREVVDRFVQAYLEGRTPNPCIDCNRFIKFDVLLRRAQVLGCACVVTGHYARIGRENGRWLLKKAADSGKDQTYFLYSMTQEQLAHTQFPLGELKKTEIRAIAAAHGFLNAQKRDSQDLCFVPDGDYARVVREQSGQDSPEGDFVDETGRVLGRHRGMIHYTIGQRKGLGLALERPMYVCEKRMAENQIVLGGRESLEKWVVIADDFNWIAWEMPPGPVRVTAKTRYRQKEQPATAWALPDGRVRIEFDAPVTAPACGQAVVLYDRDTVAGGGTICGIE